MIESRGQNEKDSAEESGGKQGANVEKIDLDESKISGIKKMDTYGFELSYSVNFEQNRTNAFSAKPPAAVRALAHPYSVPLADADVPSSKKSSPAGNGQCGDILSPDSP